MQTRLDMNPVDEFQRKRAQASSNFRPEFGDAQDARVLFGFRTSFLYQMMREGRIKTVLIRGRGKSRGKRLFNFDSIREMLSEMEDSGTAKCPPIDAPAKKATQGHAVA